MARRSAIKALLLSAALLVAAVPAEAASLLDILIPHGKAPAHRPRGRLPLRHRPVATPNPAATTLPPLPNDNPRREAAPPKPEDRPASSVPESRTEAADGESWPEPVIADLGLVIAPLAPFGSAAGAVAEALGPIVEPIRVPEAKVEAKAKAELPPTPEPKPQPPAAQERPDQLSAAEIEACRAGLATLDVVAEAQPPFFEGLCGAADPSLVKALEAGAVAVSPPARVDCRVATALARWIREDVQPAARATYGAPLTRLRIAGAYACRSRNHVEGAELSEHAFMNAIDIGGYEIGDRTITIADSPARTAIDAGFLDRVRKAACARFTTVIGPGTDADHADNLHLDTIRRGRNGDARICQ